MNRNQKNPEVEPIPPSPIEPPSKPEVSPEPVIPMPDRPGPEISPRPGPEISPRPGLRSAHQRNLCEARFTFRTLPKKNPPAMVGFF